jgi:Lrp/AsnC family leucine-responsive transcriptional regulator
MKLGHDAADLDDIDLHILTLLQENCKLPLAKVGEKVGLSAPSVIDRIKKLEDNRVIIGYRAILNARQLGRDVTAFIGVLIGHPKLIGDFERNIVQLEDVLECHHGVERTETMVVLSTHTERTQIAIQFEAAPVAKRSRRIGEKQVISFNGRPT